MIEYMNNHTWAKVVAVILTLVFAIFVMWLSDWRKNSKKKEE